MNNLACISYENMLSQIYFFFFFFFSFSSQCRKSFFLLQTKNPATSSSRRKLQLIFISTRIAVKFRELCESKSIEGEADCESFSKHSTHRF